MAHAGYGPARPISLIDTKNHVPQQINLYNPAFETQRTLLTFQGAIAGWIIAAFLIASVAGYELFSVRALQRQHNELTKAVADAQADTLRFGRDVAARRRDPQITQEIVRLEAEVSGRQEVMAALRSGGLGDTRGFSDHLKAFARQSFEGVWLTGVSIAAAGKDVSIEGRALQAAHVPAYLRRLNGEAAMQGHPFSELLIQEPAESAKAKATVRANFVEFKLATRPDGPSGKVGTQ